MATLAGTASPGPDRSDMLAGRVRQFGPICPEQSRTRDPAVPEWLLEIRFSV
jgi:hypothetical protein